MAQLKRKITLKQKQSLDLPKKSSDKSKYFIIALISVILIGVLLFVGYNNSNDSSVKSTSENSENIVAKTDTKDENVSNEISQKDSKEKEKKEDDASSKEKEGSESDALTPDNQLDSQQTKSKQKVTDVKHETKMPNKQLPYKKGKIYKVYQFPFGKSDYSKPNPDLDKLVKVLKQNPTMKISISAFTDNVGDVNYNLVLSKLRAKAINDYLVSKGIEVSRLSFQGRGISTKYQSNSENRRAEFVLND